jgi:hypothetical protein
VGSSSPSTTTQVNKTEPDAVTQQWRSKLYGEADKLYGQGAPDYYSGNTVVPFSQQTQTGLNMLESQAAGGATNLGAANQAGARALSGFNPAMGLAMQQAQGSNQNPWASLSGQAGQQQTTAGVQTLQDSASGAHQNQYLDSLYQSAANPVMNSVNAQFAKAGRYGSGAQTGAMTRELGNLASNIYAPAMEAERGRQLSSASQLAGIQQGDRAAQMQGYGQAGSLYEAQAGRQLQGTELAGGIYAQGNEDAARAAALLPSLYNYGSAPGQQMVNVGGAYEGLNAEQIAADQAKYDYTQNAPWQYLNQFAGVVNGLPQFNTATSTGTAPGANRAMGALGGAASGASMGSSFGPWGTAIGAVGGGLFGAYM